ncbi:MAG: 4-alpha-glucanotransferase, partial [Thermicanus sp.]|nr:4-alpha-glucanotransferase [Thermicanus sp.]
MINEHEVFHDSHDPLFRHPFGALPTGEKLILSLWVSEAFHADQVQVRIYKDGEQEGEEYPLFPVMDRVPVETHRPGENRVLNGLFFITSQYKEEEREGSLLGHLYQADVPLPSDPGLIWYYFLLWDGDRRYYYGNNSLGQGGIGELTSTEPLPYQVTLFERGFQTPSWLKKGIVYQIFVDRFFNGNEDGRILHPKKNALLHAHWEDDPLYIRDERGHVIRWDFFGGNLLGVLKKLPYLKELGVTAIYFN